MPVSVPPQSCCIYCEEPPPFSDEHIIPASIGADDREWLLKKCVCKTCNTAVFSPLELEFARSSPFSISRLALQPESRGRGSKTETPRLQTEESLVYDSRNRIIAEAILEAGLDPLMLPQIHLVPDENNNIMLLPQAKDLIQFRDFVGLLQRTLATDTCLIDVAEKGEAKSYDIHHLKLIVDRYKRQSTETLLKPPGTGIWFAPLAPVRNFSAEGDFLPTPRVYRHQSGSLNVRSDTIDVAIRALDIVRPSLSAILQDDQPTRATLESPRYLQRMNFNMLAIDRVLAKISLNIIAAIAGIPIMRHRCFRRVRQFVLYSKPRLRSNWQSDVALPVPLSSISEERHIIGIRTDRFAGIPIVTSLFRLYHGPVVTMRLTVAFDDAVQSALPVWLSIDYKAHKVTLHQAGRDTPLNV